MTENTHSFDKWSRSVWKVGCKVEVYLPPSNQWCIGEIIDIQNDCSLDIEYAYNNEIKTKSVYINDSMIRPWTQSITIYKYIFDAISHPKQEMIEEKDTDIIDIIDTHIHLWDINKCKRKWMNSIDYEFESLKRTYDIDEYYEMYNKHSKNINLLHGIFMETHVDDNNDIKLEIDEITQICKNKKYNLNGMIIKLEPNQSTDMFLKQISELEKNEYIVGFRRVLMHDEYDKNNYKLPDLFIENLKILSESNEYKVAKKWPFDLCVNIDQLEGIEILIKSVPKLTFVLDHCGNHHHISYDKSDNKQLFDLWKQQIISLSQYKNLNIKLSGMTGGQKENVKWSFDSQIDAIDFVLKYFDVNRIVYGSDWPVALIPLKTQNDKRIFLDKWPKNLYYYLKKKYGMEYCKKILVENPKRIYNL